MSRALYFLSAVIHPMSEIHDRAGEFLLWNPLAHMIELLRGYALGMRPYYGVNVWYPLGFMLFMLFLGFMSYYANRFELLKK
jgi:capsular polysaccharide transport system permease protein